MDIRLIRLNKHLKAITDRIDDLEPYLSICRDIPNIESLQWEMTDSFIKTIPTKYIKSNGAILQLELEKEYKDLVESYLSNLITFIEKCEKYGYPETHIDNLYEQAEKLQEIIGVSANNQIAVSHKNNQDGHRTGEKPFVKWLKCDDTNQEDMIAKLMIEEVEKIRKQADNKSKPRLATPIKCMLYALYQLGLSRFDPKEGYDLSCGDRTMVIMHQSLQNFLGDFNTPKALANASDDPTKISYYKTMFSVVLSENLP